MSAQTWFITGASSGLGASVANAALRAGHRVAVTARDKVRLEKLTEAHPDAVLPLSMDLTKPSEIKAAKFVVFFIKKKGAPVLVPVLE